VRSLENNLASNPYRNEKMLTAFFVVVTVLCIAFTVHNVHGYVTADARRTALQESLAQHKREMREIENKARGIREALAKIDDDTLATQWDFVQGIQAQRDIAWTRLFNWLEEVIPWNVRLDTIRPGTRGKRVQITITGVAKDLEAYVDCQGVIEESIPFSEVDPGSWSKKQSSNEVNFTMSFIYEDPALVRKDPAVIAAETEEGAPKAEGDEVWIAQGEGEGEGEDLEGAESSAGGVSTPARLREGDRSDTALAAPVTPPDGSGRAARDGAKQDGRDRRSAAAGGSKGRGDEAAERAPGGRSRTGTAEMGQAAGASTGFLPGRASAGGGSAGSGSAESGGAGGNAPRRAGERTVRRHEKPKEVQEMDLTRPRTLMTLPDTEDPSARVATGPDGEPIIKLDSVPGKKPKKEGQEGSSGEEAAGGEPDEGGDGAQDGGGGDSSGAGDGGGGNG